MHQAPRPILFLALPFSPTGSLSRGMTTPRLGESVCSSDDHVPDHEHTSDECGLGPLPFLFLASVLHDVFPKSIGVSYPAEAILWPAVAKLLRLYPDIHVEIIIDYGLTDIVAERTASISACRPAAVFPFGISSGVAAS